MLAKPLASGVIALVISALLFLLMDFLISGEVSLEKKEGDRSYLNFIRVDPSKDDVRTKDRKLPEPPPPPDVPPETPDFAAAVDNINTNLSMNMPSIGVPMNDGGGPYLGTLQSGQGLAGFDTDVIPVVQVAPAYPRQAKQAGIEGSVTMEVLIRPDGTVSNAKVIESDPPRLFDEAAITAMQKWKFRPKIVDGNPVSQRARQTIEFTLGRRS
jgi:periplasmic protein TonB